MHHPRYVTDVDKLEKLDNNEKRRLKRVTEKFSFRANDYYLSLINWEDTEDPIRRLVIPCEKELEEWGSFDPSNEKKYTVMQGVEHKYDSTVLLLVSSVCGGICRYCFRKRIFHRQHSEIVKEYDAAFNYIREHKEITNVLLTGGDPLMLSTKKLAYILDNLRKIEHVKIIRLGSKIPVFNPFRILEDTELIDLIGEYSTLKKKIYVITDINHPQELTPKAIKALNQLQNAGAILANQTPLIRGLNDDPEILASLFRRLSFIGVTPYYVFQCRPSTGNKDYVLPVEESYLIFEEAKTKVSGLAKRSHFVLSHSSGKIEVVGLDQESIYFKYHRAFDNRKSGKFLTFKRKPGAYWFDDYLKEKTGDERLNVY